MLPYYFIFIDCSFCFSLIWNAEPTIFDVPNPPPSATTKRPLPHRHTEPSLPAAPQLCAAEKIAKTNRYIQKTQAEFLCRKNHLKESLLRRKRDRYKFKSAMRSKNRAIGRLRKRLKKSAAATKNAVPIETVLATVKPFLSGDQFTLFEGQLKNGFKKRNVYSDTLKELLLSIHFKSSSCYKDLSRRLNLPQKQTLSKWLSHINFQEGFDEDMFAFLQLRVNEMPPENTIVTLMADEISLKEICDYNVNEDQVYGVKRSDDGKLIHPCSALVFMVTGVRAKWRQAVAYFFAKNAVPASVLLPLVLECITRLEKCGLNVVNFTSDQGSNFSSLLSSLKVTSSQPYFVHNEKKIFATPDPPHLLKSVRNTLMGHDIETSDGRASWKHLFSFYEIDKTQCIRVAPKLKNEHLEPPAIYGKMNVRLAAQVFSHSVSSGMQSHVSAGSLSTETLPTAKFCSNMNHVFDILNTSQKRAILPFQSGLTTESTETLDFIDTAILWFHSFKIFDKYGKVVNSKFRCIDGIILALTSVKHLMFFLHKTHNLSYLLTRRLCQDSLENYFSIIRQKNGFNSNPSCLAFKHSYKITQCC
jgi:hypothetical protein